MDLLRFDAATVSTKLADLEASIGIYSAPLLEGCNEEWMHQERRSREQACLDALQKLAEAAMLSGDYRAATTWYRRATELDPWWDGARRGLMQALARNGDLNEALQVYRSFSDLLRSDSAAVPDEQTTSLYERLRAESRSAGNSPSHRVQPVKEAGYIPSPLTALVGRDDERLDVSVLLKRSRLVTLTGFGGIGKTRLALAVAADNVPHFPDGVWFVGLEELLDGNILARRVGGVLGLNESPTKTWLQSLTDLLRDKRSLLVLDNCEHLREACAQIALHLLSECPGLKILSTSRQALGVAGESAWIVPALAVPGPDQLPSGLATLQRVMSGYEGVQLFVERARAAVKGFAINGANARTVADICFRLEGIPLALELAAARVKTLTLEQISDRLRNRLDLLPIGRIASSRQQTLRSTLEWSHDLLSQAEQISFRRLAVFVGGWTIDAIAHVCPDGMNIDLISDLASSLVDKSLVSFEADGANLDGRYRWPEIVRQYAEEKLLASDEAETLRMRHLAWSVALAEEAEPQLKGPEQLLWLQRLRVEMPNLQAAADWAATNEEAWEEGLRLTGALAKFWYIRGDFREGRARLGTALSRPGAERRSLARAKALYGVGILAYRQGDYDEAQASHEESLSIRRELNDNRGIAESLLNLGNIAHSRADYAKAESLYEDALRMLKELEDQHGMGLVLSNLAIIKLSQGQNRVARDRFEQSLKMHREIGDRFQIAWGLNNLGILAAERGDYLAAQAHLQECLPIFEGLGDRRGVAWSLQKLADIEHDELRYDAAQALFEKSLAIFDDLGDKHGRACSIQNMGVLARDLGDMAKARSILTQALGLFREIDDNHGIAYVIQRRGELARVDGDLDEATAANAEALAMFVAKGESRGIMRVLQERAMIAATRGDYELAMVTWGAADAMREELDLFIAPNEMNGFEPLLTKARDALGARGFEAAVSKGRSLKWEEALQQPAGTVAVP